ncbi:MAG: hypothetical protein NTW09_02495 [Candidatus Omnitrophica bacterium]|nr:hypothetical protein [Candidatus Omnitrophota bacterium]
MKKALLISAGVVVVFFALSVVKDLAVKVSVENGVQFVTGLKLRINNFNAGIIRQVVNIGGLKLYNPKGFKDKVMLDMPRIYVDYDLPAIFKGVVHLKEIRLDMKELVVVKNEKGELNLNSLNVVKAGKGGGQPSGKQGKAPAIKIDNLHLKIGKAVYKDYSRGGAPDVREFSINIDEKYTNIDNPYALVGLIVVRALTNTSISGLANFDLKGLQSTVSDTLRAARETASRAASTAKESIRAVGKTAEQLQGVFKNPFGK